MFKHTSIRLHLLACGLALWGAALALPGLAHAKAPEPIHLNFINADIDTVARALANLTGRNLVLDPRVKGTMTDRKSTRLDSSH